MQNPEQVKAMFGRRCREYREAAGESQDGFAARVGLGRGYYWQVEHGEINVCIESAVAIANGLGVTVADLFRPDAAVASKRK